MSNSFENTLQFKLPEGLLVDRAWLKKQGFARPQVDMLVRSGKLVAAARGIYRRPGPALKWEHAVYSLNQLGYSIHVGGKTAIELLGFTHYLSMGSAQIIVLFGDQPPVWLATVFENNTFRWAGKNLCASLPEASLNVRQFGHWDWEIKQSGFELALLECVAEIETVTDFAAIETLFDKATGLRPLVIQRLLECCNNVKAKRLFLWFAERHHHVWLTKLNVKTINLGSGKRQIIKGGKLDQKYQITVPVDMNRESSNVVF